VAAVAAASGQAAQFMAIGTIAEAGDNIVSTSYCWVSNTGISVSDGAMCEQSRSVLNLLMIIYST